MQIGDVIGCMIDLHDRMMCKYDQSKHFPFYFRTLSAFGLFCTSMISMNGDGMSVIKSDFIGKMIAKVLNRMDEVTEGERRRQ